MHSRTKELTMIALLLCMVALLVTPAQGQKNAPLAVMDTESTYRITSMWQVEKSLDVVNNASQAFHPMLSPTEESLSQCWNLVPVSDGLYRIINKQYPDKSLEGKDNNTVVLAPTNNGSGQFWKFRTNTTASGTSYRIVKGEGKSVDIINDGKNNEINLSPNGNYAGQYWKFTALTSVPPSSKSEAIVSESKVEEVNGYPAVTMGEQVWMSKNLNVTRYRNGDPIPQIEDPVEWARATTGAWCYSYNASATGEICGKIYNGWAIMDPRGLAPAGWRIATYNDWSSLIDFVAGMENLQTRYVGVQSLPGLTKGGTSKGMSGTNNMVVDPDFKNFDVSRLSEKVTLPYIIKYQIITFKPVKEPKTLPVVDFFKINTSVNKYGLNLTCCGNRKSNGEFNGLQQTGQYATFVYPTDMFLKEDGLFYWKSYQLSHSYPFACQDCPIKQGIVYVTKADISIFSCASDNSPDEAFYDAVFSNKNLNNPKGLGGSPAGYVVRCVRGDQWLIGDTKEK